MVDDKYLNSGSSAIARALLVDTGQRISEPSRNGLVVAFSLPIDGLASSLQSTGLLVVNILIELTSSERSLSAMRI